MIDALKAETTDQVKLEEAKTRSALLDPDSIKYSYKLALRCGDKFLGEAEISFKVNGMPPEADSLWLNASFTAIAAVYLNGTDLAEYAKANANTCPKIYERHRLTIPRELLKQGECETNILNMRYLQEYSD
mmetsp:Transcript_19659/g.26586  ORF Transcript_19659/g.26586 Transcript_19659/m.26586 type:complete len:131 (+) Transcript_19659:86-478(+)